MRRLKYPTEDAARAAEAADALVAFVGVGKKKSPPRFNQDKARKELREMLTEGEFTQAKSLHFVALYEWAHEQVYGVLPAEFSTKTTWKSAMFAASKLLKDEFAGDPTKMVDYIRWTWKREKSREVARRQGKNPNIGRLGWRLQFVTRHLVTDYRIDLARGGNVR